MLQAPPALPVTALLLDSTEPKNRGLMCTLRWSSNFLNDDRTKLSASREGLTRATTTFVHHRGLEDASFEIL